MMKRIASVILCAVMVLTCIPAFAPVMEIPTASALSTNLVTLPSHDGLTNNVTYTLGAGTDAQVDVICDFRASTTSPTDSITPKYVTIHNTGTYVSTATAKNVHNNTNKSSGDMAWHYTVDNVGVYQGLQDTRWGWHIGSVSKNPNPTNTNGNSIGIEMCVNNFPATETFDGEQWTDGTGIMHWWINQFDQTMKHTAYLTLVLCKRWNLDWRTDVKMHYDALNYYPGGKDCPMQMRAIYDPVTNTFTEAGSYVDGRDGYFWQIFWGYLEAYASGAKTTDGFTTAEKLGTYVVTPSAGLNVRAEANSSATKVGALEQGTIVKITELSGNWGKVTLEDGVEGWCNITDYGEYIGIDAQAYTTAVNSDGLLYSFDSNGSFTIKNTSTEQGQFDFFTPVEIGTATTPYLATQITPVEGDGYYFGVTKNASGYFMMHDSTSSDALTAGTTSTYCTTAETLEIPLQQYWKPDEGYQIDQVRFYIAPGATIRIDYLYFAATSGKVTDTRYNLLSAATNINLMIPSTLSIADRTKYGSFEYSNGMLKVTADTDSGFAVVFDVNQEFDANVMKRLLIAVEAEVPFNISLLVTNSEGEGFMTLVNDFYPGLGVTPVDGFIPAWTGTAGLDLYNYFVYNNVMPVDGMSTVKQVRISVGAPGTIYVNSLQLSENDRILNFPDGMYVSDAVTEDPNPPVPAVVGDVNGDGEVSTQDARLIISHIIGTATLTDEQLAVADYDGDGQVSTIDVREMLFAVLVV